MTVFNGWQYSWVGPGKPGEKEEKSGAIKCQINRHCKREQKQRQNIYTALEWKTGGK